MYSKRVQDPGGAIVAGAELTATNTGPGIKRTAKADGTGSFALTNLPVGPYRLEALLRGSEPTLRLELCCN